MPPSPSQRHQSVWPTATPEPGGPRGGPQLTPFPPGRAALSDRPTHVACIPGTNSNTYQEKGPLMKTRIDQRNREGRNVRMKPIRNKLAAAAATCALLGAATTLSFSATSASASQPGQSSAALGAALRGDLSRYLTD